MDSESQRDSKKEKEAPKGDTDHRTKRSKKDKEYAWMDSGDEDSADRESSAEPAEAEDSARELPTPASVEEVQSFSEMLRMAPALAERASDMAPAEVAAVCAASARVRFYDGPLLQAIRGRLRKLLTQRSAGGLSSGMLVTILTGLAELNSYDREVFVNAVSALASPGAANQLDKAQRKQLLESLKLVKHTGAEAFIDMLSQRVGAERYETAKDELMKRNLQRMYGNTLDLQGASEDVERALLRPRFQKNNRDVIEARTLTGGRR